MRKRKVFGSAVARSPSNRLICAQTMRALAMSEAATRASFLGEAVEGVIGETALLPAAHPVLDTGMASVTKLERGDLSVS
jgi:hypothetical protein